MTVQTGLSLCLCLRTMRKITMFILVFKECRSIKYPAVSQRFKLYPVASKRVFDCATLKKEYESGV